MKRYKIVIIGAFGKLGKVADEELSTSDFFEIVARVGKKDKLEKILKQKKPDVALELTNCDSVRQNAITILEHKVRPVIGASGLKKEDIEVLQTISKKDKIGGLIIPNFSIASALAISFVGQLSKYYEHLNIIEYHHSQKKDKPSGTARHTAEISNIDESKILSVRSDSYLAKQTVTVSGLGERLVVDHESFNRSCFKKGIKISCEKVIELNELKVGLEKIL